MARTARSIRLPDELWGELTDIAREQKRSVNNLIEVMLSAACEPTPFLDEVNRRK